MKNEFSPAKTIIDLAEYEYLKGEIIRLKGFVTNPEDKMADPQFAWAIGLLMQGNSASNIERMIGVRLIPVKEIIGSDKLTVYMEKIKPK